MRVFVTGSSGWIGSALVPQLRAAGHQVNGLVRSDASAAALTAAGAEPVRGGLDDLAVIGAAAAASDGVVHLAFKHEEAFSGNFQAAADADRRVVETIGDALAGTGRPFLIASGILGLPADRVATERDVPPAAPGGLQTRLETAQVTLELASRNVRSGVVRLSPTVHGEGDHGFIAFLTALAREKGVSGYVGEGTNRWAAVHVQDAARLFQIALEAAPAGSVLHGVAEEGVPMRDIAAAIGRGLDIPVASIPPERAAEHFTWMAHFVTMGGPVSHALTSELTGWEPQGPGLIADIDAGHYFRVPA